jgi:FkbM family methyltransferase
LTRTFTANPWLERLAAARGITDLRANLQAHYTNLNTADLKGVAVVGVGPEGKRLVGLCKKYGITIVALTDDHPQLIGKEIDGQRIAPVASLEVIDRDVPVVIASHRILDVTERIRKMGFVTVLPFAALQILAPGLFPAHMFYDGLLEDLWNNRDRYFKFDCELGDQRSHDVLNAVLGFRQTLDPATLRPVLDSDDLYMPKGLIKFSTNEVYVEGGAYDGDTILSFIDKVNGQFDRVYAFEPDRATYKKLVATFSLDPRVQSINAGLHREKALLKFRDDASRGAIFASDGTVEMPVTALDDVLKSNPVTYIKLNIEGAEIDALYGAQAVIRRERPKLALSVYHRPSDLWKIPEIVKELDGTYDLYLRQHDGGIIETVLYALHK